MFAILIIFLTAAFYTWIIYPVVVIFISRILRPRECKLFSDDDLPSVAVIISAYNEETHICGRICNILESTFPSDKITVLVGIDGSSDKTAEAVQKTFGNDKRIRVVNFPERRGKSAVLKDLVAMVDEEILVFTDANTVFDKDAIRRLIMPLKDSTVGCVCGRLVFLKTEKQTASENVYWNFETTIKKAESKLDSCLGANGAIYAMKKDFFWKELPSNTIVEDFVIGMKVREAGKKVVFEPLAVAYEELPEHLWEWGRRIRIGTGDFQSLQLCGRCLLPHYGMFAWMFLSHKVIRWVVPLLGVLTVIGAVVDVIWDMVKGGMVDQVSLWVLLIVGVVFLAIALVGRSGRGVWGVFRHFVLMQVAIVVGFLRYLRGGLKGYWERTPRRT